MALPWLGFICGLISMCIFQQPLPDVKAIAIETGIQNTGISIFLLKFSMVQPDADLTTGGKNNLVLLIKRKSIEETS